MKSMTLTTTREPIPASILALAVDISSRIGDQDITVTIRDDKTGREYLIEPIERRKQNAENNKTQLARGIRASVL